MQPNCLFTPKYTLQRLKNLYSYIIIQFTHCIYHVLLSPHELTHIATYCIDFLASVPEGLSYLTSDISNLFTSVIIILLNESWETVRP